LVGETSPREPSSAGPPEECFIEGEFIGEDECRSMMEKTPESQQEKTELSETAAKKSFFQRVIGWFKALFK